MNGVDMGIAIIPGVLVVCTMVMLLTNGVGPEGVYRRHLSRRSFPNLGGREVVLHPYPLSLDFLIQQPFLFQSPL